MTNSITSRLGFLSICHRQSRGLRDALGLKQFENTRHDGQHRIAVLTPQSRDDNCGVVRWRAIPNVRKIQIERDKETFLVPADAGDGQIGGAPQFLVDTTLTGQGGCRKGTMRSGFISQR